nr:hypothetical protein [Halorubrum sp. Ib24]
MTAAVRVRGVYATALTRLLLDAGHEVVDASPPIRRRFDADFGDAPPDVRIETTGDRQGVGVRGDPETVAGLRERLAGVGRDALAWTDPTPPGTVLDGEVTETLGGGAVVRLRVGGGDDATAEGYLPYGSVDDRVETGDPVRVRVDESAAPWTDRRPGLDGSLRAGGGLVALEPGSGTRVDVRNDEAARELSGMLDLLGLEPPDGWRAVWKPPAVDAGTETLEAGLERAVAAAEGLDEAVDAAGGIGVLDDPGLLRDAADRVARTRASGVVRPREPVRRSTTGCREATSTMAGTPPG